MLSITGLDVSTSATLEVGSKSRNVVEVGKMSSNSIDDVGDSESGVDSVVTDREVITKSTLLWSVVGVTGVGISDIIGANVDSSDKLCIVRIVVKRVAGRIVGGARDVIGVAPRSTEVMTVGCWRLVVGVPVTTVGGLTSVVGVPRLDGGASCVVGVVLPVLALASMLLSVTSVDEKSGNRRLGNTVADDGKVGIVDAVA